MNQESIPIPTSSERLEMPSSIASDRNKNLLLVQRSIPTVSIACLVIAFMIVAFGSGMSTFGKISVCSLIVLSIALFVVYFMRIDIGRLFRSST